VIKTTQQGFAVGITILFAVTLPPGTFKYFRSISPHQE